MRGKLLPPYTLTSHLRTATHPKRASLAVSLAVCHLVSVVVVLSLFGYDLGCLCSLVFFGAACLMVIGLGHFCMQFLFTK